MQGVAGHCARKHKIDSIIPVECFLVAEEQQKSGKVRVVYLTSSIRALSSFVEGTILTCDKNILRQVDILRGRHQ